MNNYPSLKTYITMYSKSHPMPRTIGGIIEDIFDKGLGRALGDDAWNDNSHHAPVNIQESEKAYELQVFAPGLKKEDFKVNVDRNILVVSFDHKEESVEESSRMIRKEYKVQSFRRSFTLNDKMDVPGIQAKYTDGVLLIQIPKKEPNTQAPQQINVG